MVIFKKAKPSSRSYARRLAASIPNCMRSSKPPENGLPLLVDEATFSPRSTSYRETLAYARGSDQSRDRQGAVASKYAAVFVKRCT